MIPHYGLTWNLLPLMAALAVMTGAGSLLARLLAADNEPAADGRSSSAAPRRRAWGWSFLLGMALVGIGLQIPLAIDGHITKFSFGAMLLLCATMTALELFFKWREYKGSRGAADGLSYAAKFLRGTVGWVTDLPVVPRTIALVSVGIMLWFATIEPTIIFDARSAFGLKARILYDTGDLRSEDFRDVDRVHFNANYPLLVPLVEANLFAAQGSNQNLGLQLLFAGFVLACASVLVSEIVRFELPAWAAAWGVCFLLLPLSMSPIEGGGLGGSGDFPLAAFTTAGVIAAGRLFFRASIRTAILAGLMLGAGVVTKQEGMIWLLAIGGAAATTILLRRGWRQRALMASLATTAGIAFGCAALAVLNRRGIPISPYFRTFQQALHWEWLVQTISRVPHILEYSALKFVSLARFDLIWLFVVVVLLLLRRPKTSATVTFWRITVALMAAAYFAIFMITPLHLEYQLRTAFMRLVIHFLPVAMLIAAEQLQASGWSRQMQWIFTGSTLKVDDRGQSISTTAQSPADRLPEKSKESRAA